MKRAKSIQIADRTFSTKKEVEAFAKSILNKYDLNEVLDYADLVFMTNLLTRHPEHEAKVGCGIKDIIIKQDGKWKTTRCFHIIRTDGTLTDFSYLTCINHNASREPLNMFKKAARTAVEDQIIAYLVAYNNRSIDKNNQVICAKTKARIPKKDAQVDHMPPLTFDKIVMDFLEARNLNLSQIEYDGFGDNQYNKRFRDELLAADFSKYHKQVARLRVISKKENLTQKKKGYNVQLPINFE